MMIGVVRVLTLELTRGVAVYRTVQRRQTPLAIPLARTRTEVFSNMKRSALFVAAALLCTTASVASAQLGITAGYSYGSAPNSGGVFPGDLSAHSGIALGVRAVSSSPIGFGIEGIYAERGFTSSTAGASRRFTYIDVPVYLNLQAKNPSITPFGYVGPQASFEIKCDVGDGNDCPSGNDKVTYAGVIGAGLRFGMLMNLSIEGRYVYGLTDLNYSTVTSSSSYKTRGFMILAGISF